MAYQQRITLKRYFFFIYLFYFLNLVLYLVILFFNHLNADGMEWIILIIYVNLFVWLIPFFYIHREHYYGRAYKLEFWKFYDLSPIFLFLIITCYYPAYIISDKILDKHTDLQGKDILHFFVWIILFLYIFYIGFFTA